MAGTLLSIPEAILNLALQTPTYMLLLIFILLIGLGLVTIFITLHLIAPKPREPYPSEKTYITTQPDGNVSLPRQLPCWYDRWRATSRLQETSSSSSYSTIPPGFPVPQDDGLIEPAEVAISVVIPAYNEADRILPTLKEMVEYLDEKFGRPASAGQSRPSSSGATVKHHRLVFNKDKKERGDRGESGPLGGYEILVVNDGSKDSTVQVALEFSKQNGLHDILRVVTLEKNRGKGGGVTHGMRHVRGEYAIFADADGASRFSDLGKLIEGCEDVVDGSNRGVAIGSRAHLVGSEVVVKRSAIRNFLMRSFHFILMILTPPATSRIRDTQCGFKLFSRAALPHIIPYMHSEGWIFDIEMLMLAESAPATPVLASDGSIIGTSCGIKVAEVPIQWHEVDGSKMNLVMDSIRMAIGLAVLRASWMMGVYRRRLS
ncbi:dolichyl-phosphate beta-glucosyltransferase [Rhypophila decipiens]|uniref:dolichyl-phosphate beta-glucosyltransferase n=1 Tax=Rhypophila decipiens TaxID=261697 RepID=A0AAN6YEI4_9PEZI|nr:dolichyl-phosphate beta-glucosyltransferase [Rhypophila decipiens]